VYVEANGKTRVYGGNEAAPFPALKKAEVAKLSVISCTAGEKSGGAAKVVVTVKNSGELEGDDPTAVVSFLDSAGAANKKIHVRLEAKLAGASEETFEITVPGAPDYESVQSGICWGGAERMALPDPPPDEKQVALSGVRIVRLTDGWGRIGGSVRNGLGVTIDKVVAGFKLGKKDAPFTVPGALKPGQVFPFEFYVADCPPFEDVTFGLSYAEAPASAPNATTAAAPTVKRVDSKKIDVAQAKLPEPAKQDKDKDKPAGDSKGAPKIELRGVMQVEGIYVQVGQAKRYSGTTYLLKLLFTDENGKTFQPTPTMNFVVYNGQEPYKKAQRIVTKEQWNADASKIEKKTVADNTIACDKKTGELWVAFVRTEGFEPGFDLTLEMRNVGTWIWKGIGNNKEYTAAARGPDKVEKK
jgi:hypothetical protein